MKKLSYILVAALALFAVACNPEEGGGGDSTVTLSLFPTTLSFEADAASAQTFTVSATGNWTVSATDSWIHYSPTSGSVNGTVSVTVDKNESEARGGKISVACGNLTKDVFVSQKRGQTPAVDIVPAPAAFDGTKRAGTTYQLLIYSFADSDGDGIGDFKGIKSKLDYLDEMGVTALWLSPAHPTGSYHGYDVNDYMSVNPKFGTESDFKDLIDAAHAKGISIYMDFVLNHSGSGHEWFKSVKADPAGSPYRDYYVLSKSPEADGAAGKVDNYGGGTSIGMGNWISLGDGEIGYKGRLHFKVDWTGTKKYVTVTETTEAAQSGNTSGVKRWIHVGNGSVGLYETSTNIFEITLDVDTNWGFLVRTSNTTWDGGTKYGAKAGQNVITFGQPLELDNGSPVDIVFGATTYYLASFDGSMPDLNYGKYTECENSPAFKATVDAAKKWVGMGVDGFRLDAVIWIYQSQVAANQRFLDQWYQAVNQAYKDAGHTENIFMVGEAWDGHNIEKQYYKGLPSNFEFDFGYKLRDVFNNGSGASAFVSSLAGFVSDHKEQRADAITSTFLSNHDQDRFASEIGKSVDKEKQAAAVLLSAPGKPFIYQGEELGYYGTKDKGDEYVRTPILWDKAGTCAKSGVNGKVDAAMLKAEISVEAQEADKGSILNVYKTWSQLRNTYDALATGEISKASISGQTVAAWYMTAGSQKLLVIHNLGTSAATVSVTDKMDKPVALLGKASVKDKNLTLGANSSVVFEL